MLKISKTKLGKSCILCGVKKTYKKYLRKFDQHYLNMETIFMNTENSKTNESNKFIYQFTDKPNLKNPHKNIGLVNLSIY